MQAVRGRAQATARARGFHRAAGAELAECVARIKTVEDRKIGRRPDGSAGLVVRGRAVDWRAPEPY